MDYVTAVDCKLANILLGLSGHGGKFACLYCEALKGLKIGITRTYGRILECGSNYRLSGSNPKGMQEFANVINTPLIKMNPDQEIIDAVPPPELHLLMESTNVNLALLRQYLASKELEDMFWDWCDSNGITKRGIIL